MCKQLIVFEITNTKSILQIRNINYLECSYILKCKDIICQNMGDYSRSSGYEVIEYAKALTNILKHGVFNSIGFCFIL